MKIPFGKTFKITPAQLRDGVAEELIDVYQSLDGSFLSRDGLKEYQQHSGSSCDGVYVDTLNREITVSNGLVYVDGTVCTGDLLNIGTLCTFAEDVNNVFIAHGGYIAKVDCAALTVTLLDSATAPNGVTHVVYCQGYLMSNGTSGITGDTFYTGPYTAVDYLTTWEVYNNESLADGLFAIAEDGQFVYNFGSRSVEVANNDGVTPWARYSMSYINYGIHAPYSLAKLDNTFYWLGVADGALRVLSMKGGSAQTISTPYDTVINNLTTTDDAYAFEMGIDGQTFYLLQFPSEQLTLVYHLQQQCWYRWGYYNLSTAEYDCYLGRCHAFNSVKNRNIIGLRNSGNTAVTGGFSDLGNVIRASLTSGNISGNTYRMKRGGRMRFQLQRGMTTDYGHTPVITWQCRDDGGKWKPERSINLGSKGDYGYIAQLDRCGIYRERQHRVVFTDTTCQMILVDIEEYNGITE